ncbi:ArsR family transcriptional regulator, partial [Planctomycetota bacterium]
HLNTVARAPAEAWARPASGERLAEMSAVLEALAPVDAISDYSRASHESLRADAAEAIVAALARRPCGAAELAASLGLAPSLVIEHIDALERAGEIERVAVGDQVQFRARPT